MLYKISIFIFILISLLSVSAYNNKCDNPSEQECSDRIHRKCTHTEKYTEQEIDNARIWLQERFAKTNPLREPCKKLYVRKDIKCLSEEEIDDLIDVIKQLYENGVVSRFAEIHYNYWAADHKFAEGVNWHQWFTNKFEQEMMKMNPSVTLPYWNWQEEFIGAEKSIVFDIFGHSGTADNDYCVADGRLPYAQCTFPTPHCIRRKWRSDDTTDIWEPPEWVTAGMQMGIRPEIMLPALVLFSGVATPLQTYLQQALLLNILSKNLFPVQLYFQVLINMALNNHFKTHLSLGGWPGDLSVMYAPCDFLFYMFHDGLGLDFHKWSLQNDENLVPESYSLSLKFISETQFVTTSDINTDTFNYYRNVTVKESFQLAYGENCYIHDVLIKAINDIIKKKKPKLPLAYYRLKSALPQSIFEKYFPKFALCPEDVSYFDYDFPDIGNCNPLREGVCREMPIALNMTENANGRRQYEAFKNTSLGGIDLSAIFDGGESLYVQFMKDLNNNGYCSPYA